MKFNALVLALLATLGGCASQVIQTRTMPAETPAADNAAAIVKMQALATAAQEASAPAAQAKAVEARDLPAQDAVAPKLTVADAPSPRTYDPFERLNRFDYRFNARFDEAIFLPVVTGYRRIPAPLRTGVHNFFSNLSEVGSTVNYALQWRLRLGVRSVGRFVVNTTLGIGGLFDVASKLKLTNPPTGFGTTLAKWGMNPGAYLVIPLLGPSSFREGAGLLGDYGITYGVNVAGFYRGDGSYAFGVGNAVDTRSNVNFRYYSTGSPFEYDTIRFLYVRKLLIEDEGLHAKDGRRQRKSDVPAGQ